MELLTDVKEKTIDISGFSGTLIEGRVDPEKFTEGSAVFIQNDIVRMLEIKTPEGIYIFDGVVTKENLKLSYDQILSTFRFLDLNCPEGQVVSQCKLGPCCCPLNAYCD
jgi:hypothetical protein